MNLPGLPDLDLDVLEAQLNGMYGIARELNGNFRRLMLDRKVPSEYLDIHYGHIPDEAELSNFLPDIDDQFVEYSASWWRFGDTDYFSMKVDRAVLEDTRSLQSWVDDAYAVWQSRAAEDARRLEEAREVIDREEKARRLALYENLRVEFDGATGAGTEGR